MSSRPLLRSRALAHSADLILATATVLLLLPLRAMALPTYTGSISYPNTAIATLSQTNSSGVDLSDSKDGTFDPISAGFFTVAHAVAGPGAFAGGSSDVQFGCSTCMNGNTVNVGEHSSFDLEDLIVAAAPGNTNPQASVNVSLNFSLTGGMGAVTTSAGSRAGAEASVRFSESQSFGTSIFNDLLGDIKLLNDQGAGSIVNADGLFAAFVTPASNVQLLAGCTADPSKHTVSFSSPTFSVNVGQPFGILLDLSTDATVTGDNASCGEAKADFLDPLAFSGSGPVGNLPAGYTLNSVDGSIVDNAVVPEPSSAVLLAFGSVVLLAGRRRRR